MPLTPQTEPAASSSPAALSPVNATEALYRAALGTGQIEHYLPLFARFDEDGVARPVWNAAAAWFNLNWLLYRRLWWPALVFALAVGGLLMAWHAGQQVLGPWPTGVRWGLLAFVGLLAVVVPGLWGTAWLHGAVRRRMTAAVRQARTVQEACDRLRRPSPLRHVWRAALALQVAALGAVVVAVGLQWPPAALPPETPTTAAAVPRAAEPMVAASVSESDAEPESEPSASPATAPTTPPVDSPSPAPALEPPSPSPAAVPAPAAEALPSATLPTAAPILRPAEGESQPPPQPLDLRPRLQGHGVNVGMFADAANAERVRARLSQAGLPVVADTVDSARGALTRVRVGPFEQAEQAEQAAQTVRNLGLEAKVFGP